MDNEFLSKKRNKEESNNKSSNSGLINLSLQNPFFDFADNQLPDYSKESNQANINTNNKHQNFSTSNKISNNHDEKKNVNRNQFYNNKNNNYIHGNNFHNSKNEKYEEKSKPHSYNLNNSDNLNSNVQKANKHNSSSKSSIVINPSVSGLDKRRLPIEKYRDVILNYISNNQVIVIAGETGCGKTTQVPKYIYEDYLSRNDKNLNMIITQPRRIAAVSIAKRLKEELNVNLGVEVGYHVGRNPAFDSEKTKILIVTTGIFLQRIIHEKELPNISHVILDEVHERDIDIDFVMILIKHILRKHPNLKLILMSATISTHLFANYFSKENIESIEFSDYYRNINNNSINEESQSVWDDLKVERDMNVNINLENSWDNVHLVSEVSQLNYKNSINKLSNILRNPTKPIKNNSNNNEFLNSNEINPALVIKIDEKIYPVKIEYLCEIIEKYIDGRFSNQIPVDLQFEKHSPKIAEYIFDISAMLIKKIHEGDKDKNYFSILVFLPGFFEIQCMNERILNYLELEEKNIEILHLHSGISDEEQSLVFEKKNRRKIILSTNIAESSITIPDIYYVIDFCLCKELKFNIKTNHQTLELNWASKASCNQRAGRAGRVANGFVYRLLNKDFFHNEIEDFSSPELVRTPLEKLILKIKVWDCGEPDKILGRAIQPPNIRNIEAAISNLQNYGALTIPNDKSKTGELTELGKVYSELPIDIKYSRLIMLSFCFDMVEPAIVTCAILNQEKNLFRNKKSSFDLYEIRKEFDKGLNNDFTLFYLAYKTWSKKFGNEGVNEYQRKYMKRTSPYEKEWCAKYDLDFIVLKEVRVLIADLKMRLNKLNLYTDKITKNFDFAGDDQSCLFFNIVVAGAFYGKFIKCQFFNSEKIQKMNKWKDYNPQYAISIKCIVLAIKDQQIIDFFRKFGKITYFKRFGEEVIIAFSKETYQDSIKKVMLCGGYKYNMNEFIINYKPDNSDEIVSFQLKRPEYLFQLRYFDLFSQNQVEIESTSMNHVLIGESEKSVSSIFLITENYHTKKQKLHARVSAKLPEIPMLDYLLMLIFSPYVVFSADEENRQYHLFRILGSELEFRFTHLFSSIDVEEINYIRSLMNNIIKDVNDDTKIISQRESLKKQIKILIQKKRAKIINRPEWWDLLYKHYPHLEKKKTYVDPGNTDNYNSVESKQNLDSLKKNNDFLPQIKKLHGIKDHRLFMEDGKLEIEEERNCFIEMRNNIIFYFDNMKNIINLIETEVLCKQCNSYLCMAKNLVGGTDKNEFHEVTGYIGNFIQIINFNDETVKDEIYCKNILSEYDYDQNNNEISWISCSKKHIIGLFMKDKYYITNKSKIILKFPMMKLEDWSPIFYKENYKKIKIYEDECLRERRKKIQYLFCELCNVKLRDSNDFLMHLDKNNVHKQNVTDLIEEDFY